MVKKTDGMDPEPVHEPMGGPGDGFELQPSGKLEPEGDFLPVPISEED